MTEQLAQLGEGISDIGVGITLASIALAISWFYSSRMRWRPPIKELEELERLKSEGVISGNEYNKLRSKRIKRF
jgi:hypothetical protein